MLASLGPILVKIKLVDDSLWVVDGVTIAIFRRNSSIVVAFFGSENFRANLRGFICTAQDDIFLILWLKALNKDGFLELITITKI